MNTTISFRDHSETLTVTCESSFASTSFDVQCKDQDHRDEMAIKILVALKNDYFEK